jgi:hypothetical protein
MDNDHVTEIYEPEGTKIQLKIIYQRYDNKDKVIIARCHPPHYVPRQLIMLKPEWWKPFYDHVHIFNTKFNDYLNGERGGDSIIAGAVQARNKRQPNALSMPVFKRPGL